MIIHGIQLPPKRMKGIRAGGALRCSFGLLDRVAQCFSLRCRISAVFRLRPLGFDGQGKTALPTHVSGFCTSTKSSRAAQPCFSQKARPDSLSA